VQMAQVRFASAVCIGVGKIAGVLVQVAVGRQERREPQAEGHRTFQPAVGLVLEPYPSGVGSQDPPVEVLQEALGPHQGSAQSPSNRVLGLLRVVQEEHQASVRDPKVQELGHPWMVQEAASQTSERSPKKPELEPALP